MMRGVAGHDSEPITGQLHAVSDQMSKTSERVEQAMGSTEYVHRRRRRLDAVTIGGIIGLTIAVAGLVWTLWHNRQPEDVLQYAQQKVTSTVPGRSVVGGNDDVPVVSTGRKCNNSDKRLTIRGTKSWVSVQPGGSYIEENPIIGIRDPGCTNPTFANFVPDAVIERTRQLCDQYQVKYVLWQIIVVETPLDRGYQPASLSTEAFAIYP